MTFTSGSAHPRVRICFWFCYQVVKNNLNPTWRPFRIPLQSLCGGDLDKPIKVCQSLCFSFMWCAELSHLRLSLDQTNPTRRRLTVFCGSHCFADCDFSFNSQTWTCVSPLTLLLATSVSAEPCVFFFFFNLFLLMPYVFNFRSRRVRKEGVPHLYGTSEFLTASFSHVPLVAEVNEWSKWEEMWKRRAAPPAPPCCISAAQPHLCGAACASVRAISLPASV